MLEATLAEHPLPYLFTKKTVVIKSIQFMPAAQRFKKFPYFLFSVACYSAE